MAAGAEKRGPEAQEQVPGAQNKASEAAEKT